MKDATIRAPTAGMLSLFHFLTPWDRVELGIGVLTASAHGCSQPFIAFLFGQMLDGFIVDILDGIPKLILYFGLVGAGVWIVATIWNTLFNRLAAKSGYRMRCAYVAAIVEHDIAWFDTSHPMGLPTQLNDDALKLGAAIGDKLGLAIMYSTQFIFGYILAFVWGSDLALVMLAGIPLMALAGFLLSRAIQSLNSTTFHWYTMAGGVAEETLTAVKTVAACGEEKREVARYTKLLEHARQGATKFGYSQGASLGFFFFAMNLLHALAFWYGGELVANGDMNDFHDKPWNGGNVISVFFAVFMGIMGLGQSLPYISNNIDGRIAMKRFFTLMEDRDTVAKNGTAEASEFSIEFDHVEFAYPSKPDELVLKQISFFVKNGAKVALVGESGCGKSTVIALIERFYDPTSGSVKIGGSDLRTLSLSAFRDKVGLVSQEPILFAATIRDNITYGLKTMPPDEDILEACKAANVDFLGKLEGGLNCQPGAGGSQLSGGQKQRIAIARALIRSPKVLMLDEATSALDNVSEREVQRAIDELGQVWDAQLTIIAIAHRLSTIRNSDQIFFFKEGTIAESGTHEELMAMHRGYYSLVLTQSEADSHYHKEDDVGNRVSSVVISTNDEVKREDKDETDKMPKNYKAPMRRLFNLNRGHNWPFPIAMFFCLFNGAREPANAILLTEAMGRFYAIENVRALIETLVFYYLGLSVIAFVAQMISVVLFVITGQHLTKKVRAHSYESILRQDMGFFDFPAYYPGSLSTFLSVSAHRVSSVTGANLGAVVSAVASLILALIVALIAQWKVALMLIGLLPLIIAAMGLMMKFMLGGGSGEEAGGKYAESGLIASETVLSVRTVKALNGEKTAIARFSRASHEPFAMQLKKTPFGGAAFGVSNLVLFGVYAFGFWWGKWVLCDDLGGCDATKSPTPEAVQDFFRALMCIMFSGNGVALALAFVPNAQDAKEAAFDLFKILDRKSAIDPCSEAGLRPPETAQTISFENVSFSYPARSHLVVVSAVSFVIEPNTSTAFCGPSGSGKSTIIQLMQRFYDPHCGVILVGSTPLTDLNIRMWRQSIGLVGQEPVLFNMSVLDNIRYGCEHATKAMVESAAAVAKIDFVGSGKQIDWDDAVGPRGTRLSGGQKQRVAIARALIRQPTYLLLDEATSALDSQSESHIQEALNHASQNRTTFVVAHRLSTITHCDKIIVMNDSVMVESGTHAELMELKMIYYNLQMASSGK